MTRNFETQPVTDCSDDQESEELPTDTRQAPSRSFFVIPFLIMHAVITACFLPSFGLSPGAGIYEIYFIFTSFPVLLVGVFLPEYLRQSEGAIVCLVINGVLEVWAFASGLHYFLYKAGPADKSMIGNDQPITDSKVKP